jgi:hypothetical protein
VDHPIQHSWWEQSWRVRYRKSTCRVAKTQSWEMHKSRYFAGCKIVTSLRLSLFKVIALLLQGRMKWNVYFTIWNLTLIL